MTITREQKQALQEAGEQPVRLEDPETHEAYILVKAEVYEHLRSIAQEEDIDPSFFEIDDFEPAGEDPR